MRIYSMTATFGKLEHQTLTLRPGLNIIEAPNEWGKSTWCAFLVAMLYGIETRVHSTKTALADKERYAPWSGSPMSGRMELNWNGRDITIERGSRGRSIFGIFRAYETASGLEIPELTADNCGQMLLGVEKSVFTRAGFLKLTDLPVTEDKALWRRLNALVTTGDESGAADALGEKLQQLRNRCRANRANGLIPQALAQQEELAGKLQQLQLLHSQSQRIQRRQEELAEHVQKLENHRQALEYAASQALTQKAAEAAYHLKQSQEQADRLEDTCKDLPTADSIYQALHKAQQLREQREALQMEVQMQPGAPEVPQVPLPFHGCTPEQALRQAKDDSALHKQCMEHQKPKSAWMLGIGIGLLACGISNWLMNLVEFIPPLILLILGAVVSVAGLIYHNNCQRKYQDVQRTAHRLEDRYRPVPPEQWMALAEEYAREMAEYESAMSKHAAALAHIKTDMGTVLQQLELLTGGESYMQWEQQQRQALDQHKAYADAIRQLRQAQTVAQALAQQDKLPQPPQMPDTLTYSAPETARLLSDAETERHQLQLQLGHCHGQMESLGQERTLQLQLTAVQARLRKLEETYAALELAQQTLAEASAELQRRFAPRISQRAQELFGKLTDMRYDRLTLGSDLNLMVSATSEDTLRSSLWRSDGTADQLYLALRLAVAEELTPNAPLILDDALVRFDDKRLAAAMEILKEEAENKQVILFTCQSREAAYK